MPLSEIPYFKAFPVISFIVLYWNGIGGKPDAQFCVEMVDGLYKTDVPDLEQVIRFRSSPDKSPDDTPDKARVLHDEAVPRLFIPCV